MANDDATISPTAPTAPQQVSEQTVAAQVEKHFGAIRLIRLIGKGGMGEVWLGRHELLGNQVAVKILCDAAIGSSDAAYAEFIRGAKIAASVAHPGLNKIIHADVADQTPYLVLEYLDGPNLAEILTRAGRLPLPVLRSVIESVCEAITELHQHDLVHRDIKPSNIVLSRDGGVVVTDFGLACARPASALRGSAGAVAGTPPYMAPEMFSGVASARTDVYAIGITAYQLLCDQLPFTGTFQEIQRQHETANIDIEPLRSAGVPDGVIDVIVRMTSKDILFRPKTARHALTLFQAAFNEAKIKPASRDELARFINTPAAASTDIAKPVAASAGDTSATISELVSRKRDLRDATPSPVPNHSELVRADDPLHRAQRRSERRRTRLAFWVATLVGGFITFGVFWYFGHHVMGRWEQWVEVDLVHAKTVTTPLPGGGIMLSRPIPIWATLLMNILPITVFAAVGVVTSVAPYRILRGPLRPPDTENTRCGWCQHELRGITKPICSECGHRIGDQGPDEKGTHPLARRNTRRAWPILLSVFFLLSALVARMVLSVVALILPHATPGSALDSLFSFVAIAFACGVNALYCEAILQLRLTHSGRAWCRICKAELRDLTEPVCPNCSSRI